MKRLLLLALLSGCSVRMAGVPVRHVDVSTLPECPRQVLKHPKDFVTFNADNGDVLYSATKGEYLCLKRKKR